MLYFYYCIIKEHIITITNRKHECFKKNCNYAFYGCDKKLNMHGGKGKKNMHVNILCQMSHEALQLYKAI